MLTLSHDRLLLKVVNLGMLTLAAYIEADKHTGQDNSLHNSELDCGIICDYCEYSPLHLSQFHKWCIKITKSMLKDD